MGLKIRGKELLGIYLGDSGIEFHCLKGGMGGWESVPAPITAHETGRSGAEDLKRQLGSLRYSANRTICIGLPRRAFFLREISLPQLAPEEAENSVRLAIGLHAHLDPEQIYFDQIAFSRDGQTTVLLAYINRHFLDPFLRAIQDSGHGRSLGPISPATLGMDILMRNILNLSSLPCLFMGFQGGDLVVSLHGADGWEGSHFIGWDKQDEAISRLEEILRCLPGAFSSQDIPVYWKGDQASCPEGIPVGVRPLAGISGLGKEPLAPSWALCSAALGLSEYPALSLQPKPRKKPLRMRIKPVQFMAGATAAALLLASGTLGLRLHSYSHRLDALHKEARMLDRQLAPLVKIKAQLDQVQEKLSHIQSFKSQYPSDLEVLKILAQQTPRQTWIKILSIRNNRLRLAAEGDSAVETIAAWRKSPMFSEVKMVSPVIKSREQKERFSVEIILVSPGSSKDG